MTLELWLRPWGRYVPARRLALVGGGETVVPDDHAGPALVYASSPSPLRVNGSADGAEKVAVMSERAGGYGAAETATALWQLPLPVRRTPGCAIATERGVYTVVWPAAPERFRGEDPRTEDERRARALMLRAEAVWDRVSDVEDALADPAQLWAWLRRRWTETDSDEPQMDVIVRQSAELGRVLDALEKRPRRILRRVHRQVPVGRMQEIDRRAMLWLARQPGETLAERAGDDQRVLAVAREENFDTLENRALRAYGALAHLHAREYLDRNKTRRMSRRAGVVEAFGRRCGRLARELAALGVRAAEPGIIPNFVLQQNPQYRRVWNAWIELLDRERVKDELWRWQARSWEEFCTLALMVALIGVPGARAVATAPLWYRDEHHRGRWIEADTPIGVFHLPGAGLIVEVQTAAPHRDLAGFGAPIWLRIGRTGETRDALTRIPVWPIWSLRGSHVTGEAGEVEAVLAYGRQHMVRGGIVLRAAAGPDAEDPAQSGGVVAVSLGTEGAALRDGLRSLTDYLATAMARAKA
jgi:hypothetical protein